MSKIDFILHVHLKPFHRQTDHTRHYLGEQQLPSPSELRIGQYEGDAGFYLIHLDEQGDELTDTYHESIQDAVEQARLEFNIDPEDWKEPE